MNDTSFDYIIVGAGTAGCLLANRLSANASKRVLLIEAGRKDDYHWVHIPVGYLYCIGNPRTDWMYQTEPAAGLNGRSLRYPRGKVLGGCSSINGMIYMRGQSRDYDHWAEVTGDPRWRWDNALPYFKLHEDHHLGANALHGAKGAKSDVLTQGQSVYHTRPCATTTRAANGASKNSACAGTCSTPSRKQRCKPAFPPPRTSTKAPTKAWATSR